MVMFGCYLTGKPPFKNIYLHGHVRALDGRKMSKSLGNQINPKEYIEKYGVDALRMGLIFGTANGKDFSFPHDKVLAYRNFANKLWNMTRFTGLMAESAGVTFDVAYTREQITAFAKTTEDKEILSGLNATLIAVNENLEKYRFAEAGDSLYHFVWDELAAKYIEYVKDSENKDETLKILYYVFTECLKILHPFMPFITEELWEVLTESDKPLALADWPTTL